MLVYCHLFHVGSVLQAEMMVVQFSLSLDVVVLFVSLAGFLAAQGSSSEQQRRLTTTRRTQTELTQGLLLSQCSNDEETSNTKRGNYEFSEKGSSTRLTFSGCEGREMELLAGKKE